jgi:hypothetical protein
MSGWIMNKLETRVRKSMASSVNKQLWKIYGNI